MNNRCKKYCTGESAGGELDVAFKRKQEVVSALQVLTQAVM